jgi:hypothetical protein
MPNYQRISRNHSTTAFRLHNNRLGGYRFDAELGRGITMNDKILTIPEWMLKSLKDDSKLRKAEVFEIMGYKSLNSLNSSQMRGLIEKGEFPPIFRKGNCGFGLNPHLLMWSFGDVKKFVKEHNKKLTA